ncbi:MBOAT family O-acyltransferase [Adhaeribacter pallidiroseus]|uniref:Putative alginate O-acetylase AlgI n=1 Tax=Adhaeribacter pallidiroseus TaxID=2072847 RepID=A0A369QD97_9BACT|nr:MBOAT family O-acyltransferase [Adhaeribacter pallidiroseus]RDC62893.1 putative alginate O-acetylase AlgI [Adhaeribacter pallidiroseus]
MVWSLIANLGVLAIFKYFNFFNQNITALGEAFGYQNQIPSLTILLPIGLSFHTFQAMSYTIEVYRGNEKAEQHFGIYALYVMFYPQLVAGPIERPQNILHQFHEKHYFDYDRVTDGLKLMAWGLFKKVVIADRLALMVNKVYNNPTDYEGIFLIIATVFFAFQIFCDFSGYSDIALGSAQVMGFTLMENFRRPYAAKSIKEFWGRWHISLSTWFRDYLYVPLGGNRVSTWRWYYNIFIVFLVSGLWHGASWTFIIWGALHGFYQIFGFITAAQRNQLVKHLQLRKFPVFYNTLQLVTTFSLVCFAWIFFRANSLADAWYISTHLFQNLLGSTKEFGSQLLFGRNILGQYKQEFFLAVLFIIVLERVHYLQSQQKLRLEISKFRPLYRWGLYSMYLLVFIYFGVFNSNSFIYFQF